MIISFQITQVTKAMSPKGSWQLVWCCMGGVVVVVICRHADALMREK